MSKPSVADLVPCTREVRSDDTMDEFHQVLRFDIIDTKPLRSQLLLDRRHKTDNKKSHPAAYIRFSQTGPLIDLVCAALTMANVIAYQNRIDEKQPTREEIEHAVDSVLSTIRSDIVTLTEVQLMSIQLHRKARLG